MLRLGWLGLLALDFFVLALLQFLRLLVVLLLQLLRLLLVALLQILLALHVGIALVELLLFLRLFLLHALAFGVLLLAQLLLFALMLFHYGRIDAVRIGWTVVIWPRIGRWPIFRPVRLDSSIPPAFRRTI